MSRAGRDFRRLLVAALLGILTAPALPAAALDDGAIRAWVVQLQAARERLGAARQEFAAAQAEYARTRRHQRLRGKTRTELLARRDAARLELEAASAAWAPLLEQARRAGVPPGALRRFEDGDEGPPAPAGD